MWVVVAAAVALVVVGCALAASPSPTPSRSPSPGPPLRYVALGDSYTIGTSIGESERWPNQLVDRLSGQVSLDLVANLGVNGFTSDDLIRVELPQLDGVQPDFVTVLIGVNDVVQRVPADRYRANIEHIFDTLLGRLPAARILVVSTPDYTRTPMGAAFGSPEQQRSAIAEFNAIERAAAEARGIGFVDISPVADSVGQVDGLVAGDGLHPSGEQYRRWVDLIAPVAAGLFEGQ